MCCCGYLLVLLCVVYVQVYVFLYEWLCACVRTCTHVLCKLTAGSLPLSQLTPLLQAYKWCPEQRSHLPCVCLCEMTLDDQLYNTCDISIIMYILVYISDHGVFVFFRYLVSGCDSLHAGVWTPTFPGGQRQRDFDHDHGLQIYRPGSRLCGV